MGQPGPQWLQVGTDSVHPEWSGPELRLLVVAVPLAAVAAAAVVVLDPE